MKPEQKRIAIAEACGWTIKATIKYSWLVISPLNMEVAWSSQGGELNDKPVYYYLPDYFNDLNAMQRAVSIFDYDQADEFDDHLCDICKRANDLAENPTPWRFAVTNATAAQRAEAFGRTLNLWTA